MGRRFGLVPQPGPPVPTMDWAQRPFSATMVYELEHHEVGLILDMRKVCGIRCWKGGRVGGYFRAGMISWGNYVFQEGGEIILWRNLGAVAVQGVREAV